MFGGRPAVRTPAAPAARAPVDAPWLQYLGRSQSVDGTTTVFLKDTKTGRLISATRADTPGAWVIVDEQGTTLIVKNGDALYSVKTR